jgi:hypothetical protein
MSTDGRTTRIFFIHVEREASITEDGQVNEPNQILNGKHALTFAVKHKTSKLKR